MRLCRQGSQGQERPAIVDHEGRRRDLSAVVADINGALLAADLAPLRNLDIATLPLVDPGARQAPPGRADRVHEGHCRDRRPGG